MTTPKPLTMYQLQIMEDVLRDVWRKSGKPIIPGFDRLLYTARMGAKFVEMTKQNFIILKRADK
jgi:hypothetical protein